MYRNFSKHESLEKTEKALNFEVDNNRCSRRSFKALNVVAKDKCSAIVNAE